MFKPKGLKKINGLIAEKLLRLIHLPSHVCVFFYD